jgi:hypothetical protein
VQKYGEFLKRPNFWAKNFKEMLFFCKKSKEKGVFLIESCNFAAPIKGKKVKKVKSEKVKYK